MVKRIAFLLALAFFAIPAYAVSPFTSDPAASKQLADKLDVPVFYFMPESAYAGTADGITAADGLFDFRYPASDGAELPVSLRVYLTPHANAAKRLAAGGFIQTGDIILTFRPEWGFRGPYPNIQMGISHAAIAYVEDGIARTVENPLTDEYIGDLTSKHYKDAAALHVIRPRNLSKEQKDNILGWTKRLAGLAGKIYPAQLSFNQDYFAPKYSNGDMGFVKTLGQIALQTDKNAKVSLFCSELVWALLSLKDCDPADANAFTGDSVPACVKPEFAPMQMTGDYFPAPKAPSARLGLSDGPLAVIEGLGLPDEQKQKLIKQVFETSRPLTSMSPGHRAIAEKMAPYFLQLEGYYAGISSGTPAAVAISAQFNKGVKANYSPTSYIINTLLPADSREREMDFVGTVVFSD